MVVAVVVFANDVSGSGGNMMIIIILMMMGLMDQRLKHLFMVYIHEQSKLEVDTVVTKIPYSEDDAALIFMTGPMLK